MNILNYKTQQEYIKYRPQKHGISNIFPIFGMTDKLKEEITHTHTLISTEWNILPKYHSNAEVSKGLSQNNKEKGLI